MKAFSFTTDKGISQIGVEYQGKTLNFSKAWELYKQIKNQGKGPSLTFLQIMVEADFFHLETFEEVLNTLRESHSFDALKIEPYFTMQPPIGRPQKILCVGRNYKAHAEELGNKAPDEPIFFSKSPSSLIGAEMQIKIPAGVARVDFEGELAVIINKQAHRISENEAFEYVAGYSILNDVTARDMQKADIKQGRPWFRSKSFDTFCPFGPYLVPREFIKDVNQLDLEVRLNGEVKQQASTSQMLFSIPEIVAYISRFCTLQPGDVIATGTPAGVGPMQAGDTIECEINEMGVLKNRVIN